MNQKYIACVAGKSGGHVIPGITLMQEFVKLNPEYKVIFFSTDTKLDKTILQNHNLTGQCVTLSLGNFPRFNIFKYFKFVWQFKLSIIKSFKKLYNLRPEKIVSMGGYISIPVCFAAWLLRIPIEIYELNVVPGKAVKFLAPIATKIYICFEGAKKFLPSKKVEYASYPVKFKHIETNKTVNHKKVLLILGGSQGSSFINNLCINFVKLYPEFAKKIQFIHQTGSSGLSEIKEFYNKNNIDAIVFDFKHDITECYLDADLIISRAGAGSLFEIKFFNKSAIIIPLESKTTSHQLDNALEMANKYPELFKVIKQTEFEADLKNNLELITKQLSV